MSDDTGKAIIHAEAVAKSKEREAKENRNHGGWAYDDEAKKCSACAAEHRQLAEWLKELKQEAIGVLKLINAKTDHILINDDARSEAIDMAIKALEQSESCNDDKDCSNCMYSGRPTYKPPCSECRDNSQWEMKPISRSHENGTECEDTISRQEAIEAVEHITSSMSVCVNTDECHGMKRMQRQAVIELTNLPSAQPFHNITMNDVLKYIDGMPEDVWQEFTACLECRGWELQRRTASRKENR